jgi:hypothetical protein
MHWFVPPEQRAGQPRSPIAEAAKSNRPTRIPPRIGIEEHRVEGGSLGTGYLVQSGRDVARVLGENNSVNAGRFENLNPRRFGTASRYSLEPGSGNAWSRRHGICDILQDIPALFGIQDVGLCHRLGNCRKGKSHYSVVRSESRNTDELMRQGRQGCERSRTPQQAERGDLNRGIFLVKVSGFSDLSPLRELKRLRALHMRKVLKVSRARHGDRIGRLQPHRSIFHQVTFVRLSPKQSFGQNIPKSRFASTIDARSRIPILAGSSSQVSGAGRVKCGTSKAEQKCHEYAERYAAMKRAARGTDRPGADH